MSVNQQKISYNGFEFPFSSASVHASTVYDSRDVTQMYIKYSIHIRSWLTESNPTNLANKVKDVQAAISVSRQRFLWMMGTKALYDVSGVGNGGTVNDVRLGPIPRNFQVKKVYNGISAEIEFDIDFYTETTTTGTNGVILEFWYAYSFSQDKNYSTTRVITGQVRVIAGNNVDTLVTTDSQFWPQLPFGFYRESIQRNVSADGLSMSFTVTDRQVWRTLPQPFTDGTLTFSLNQTGAILNKTLAGSFTAPNTINKQIIAQWIGSVIRAYFPDVFNAAQDGPNDVKAAPKGMIRNFTITEHPFENRLDFSITSWTSAQKLLANTSTTAGFLTGLFPDIANVKPPDNQDWQQSNGLAFSLGPAGASGLLSKPVPPFDSVDGINGTSQVAAITGADTGNPGVTPANPNSPAIPKDSVTGDVSDAQVTYPYTLYLETWSYWMDRNLRQINATGPSGVNFVQQTASPRSYILVTGRARRLGAPADPIVPPPTLNGDPKAVFVPVQNYIVNAPQLQPDGVTLEYETQWKYEIIQPQGNSTDLDTTTLEDIVYPNNPQLSKELVNSYQTKPGGTAGPVPEWEPGTSAITGEFTQVAPAPAPPVP